MKTTIKNWFKDSKINFKINLKTTKQITSAVLGLTILASALVTAPPSQARVTPKGLAITGLVLGGTALGVAGYNTYRNRRDRRRYYRDYRRNSFRPAYYRNHRNYRRYQPRYYGARYDDDCYY